MGTLTRCDVLRLIAMNVLTVMYSCDSGEDVRKVNVNREEGMHRQREEVCTWCKLSFPDAAISPAKSSMSALC